MPLKKLDPKAGRGELPSATPRPAKAKVGVKPVLVVEIKAGKKAPKAK